MDKIYIKELLNNDLLEIFEFHPDFFGEFEELIINSGQVKKILKLFVKKLYAIKKLNNIDYGPIWLEHLKAYGNMYSLHITTNNKNYRLLFSKKSKKKYFLHVFHEKKGKKITSYDTHVLKAIERRDNK